MKLISNGAISKSFWINWVVTSDPEVLQSRFGVNFFIWSGEFQESCQTNFSARSSTHFSALFLEGFKPRPPPKKKSRQKFAPKIAGTLLSDCRFWARHFFMPIFCLRWGEINKITDRTLIYPATVSLAQVVLGHVWLQEFLQCMKMQNYRHPVCQPEVVLWVLSQGAFKVTDLRLLQIRPCSWKFKHVECAGNNRKQPESAQKTEDFRRKSQETA